MNTRDVTGIAIVVEDASQVGEARRTAVALAEGLGFDETRSGQLAIVTTELATNVVKHGGGGELVLRRLDDGAGIEVLALDQGRGMRNAAVSLQDGFSTAGSAGTGLGAIARLSDAWDIYSTPSGTAVMAHFAINRVESDAPSRLHVGAVCLPRRDELVSGDAWCAVHTPPRTIVMVADGLGHGPEANAASREAIRVFRESGALSTAEIMQRTHLALRPTRGAAVGLADLDAERRVIRFAGIGNIAGSVVAGNLSRSFVSHGGIVGHECRRVHEFEYPWPHRSLVVLHSDGLQTSWKLDRYVGLELRHPALIAGILYRDYSRRRDDVTVVALREALAVTR